MPRILCIDFGMKRVGLAVTDPLQIIASPLTTVANSEVLDYLKEYCIKEEVETIVVGQPRRMSGELSAVETEILAFIEKLKAALPNHKIDRYDERFTSKIAKQALFDSGLKKKKRQDKSLLDSTSASLILQDYLTSKNDFTY
ncbi:MAG: Holliday junction resolvase RuvX [Flavobacteriales bacterium]|nr:Holliday junction resolvase RuvX [Flavobacteriales bacterium]